MGDPVTIAIDAMGGDHGPAVTVPAALLSLTRHPDLHIILVGDHAVIRRLLFARHDYDCTRLTVRHATQVVGMDEKPSSALRGKKDSSMRVAVDLVRDNQADACVSAGNTGALMAVGRFSLRTFHGIDRPAIIASIPTRRGHCHVLDLGANVDCNAEHLFQFAIMGAVLSSAVDDIPSPRIGLLNVGEEEIKGNEQVRLAARLIQDSHYLNYAGYVEGGDIFRDEADVIVCDGFVGNIALKASEELVRMLVQFIRDAFGRNWLTRLIGGLARPVLRPMRDQLDPARNNGASLLGLRGIVVKSHGSAGVASFAHAVETALREAERDVPAVISQRISELILHN